MIEQNTTSAVPMGIFPGPDNFSGNALNPTESVAYRPGFKELIADADVQDAQTQEIPVADTRDLDFTSEGVVYRDRLVPADERCRERLFKKLEAPATYLLGHSPEFQAGALAQHVGRGDFGATPTLILAKDNRYPVKRVKPKVHQPIDSALRQAQSLRRWRADDRIGTLMRHIVLGVPLPVSFLPTTMRLFARRRSLVTAARSRQLSLPHQSPAGLATVALSTVAAATHRKHGTTVGVEAAARTQTLDGMFC